MTDNKLVSIAMCTYNGERFLKQQIDSLINQTYKNLEIIIVDDGSKDATVDMVNAYAAQDARIRFIRNEKNLGYVKNFEKAIGLCTGDFIALSDQDDEWDLNKIQLLVENIGDNILIYHNSLLVEEGGKPICLLSEVLNMYEGDSPLPFVFYNCVSGHSCMFKKELVPHLGSFDPNYFHDWWIAFVAGSFGRIKFLNMPLVNYRQHGTANTDILKARDKGKALINPVKYKEFKLTGLYHMATVKGKSYGVITKLIYLLEHKNILNSFKLFQLLLANYKEMYFFKKKSNISKINYIRKASFHTRDFWLAANDPL
ncbi:glycosyltransferase family 2 protein [Mucilaginibacter jinjuensis]|uniref:Glycosyltransferase family 2 protein n=1 Tax=Mucilaginibacter jinjuensis TaxID=1176721 RepID=A0ABY7T8C6_9SPHI|nr:glycosyltransferase family 2 protein [Mucilaginibacter jinjuensis]WCT12740.1 glycosyltransferase family 2 protein [Mucilaginibacter jinjuensis]